MVFLRRWAKGRNSHRRMLEALRGMLGSAYERLLGHTVCTGPSTWYSFDRLHFVH